MSERKQVLIRMSEILKEQWDEYAEECNRTLSGMIRRAVEQEIASDTHEDSARTPDLSGQLSEIADNLQRVENRVQEFDRRLQSVEQEVSMTPDSASW